MNKRKTIFIPILSLFTLILISSTVLAQETKVSDVLGENPAQPATTEQLDQKEAQRETDFLNQLLLEIPAETDNPSYTLTFTDPSSDKKGVQLEIDSKSYQDIKSPYSLPALSIGKHTLKFKFADKYNTTQILEKEIIILPRPPIISTPNILENKLVLTGTGLANSDLTLILASDDRMVVKEAAVDADGKWSISIEENIPSGVYSFIAYLRKYGFSSNLSQPITANIDKNITSVTSSNINQSEDIRFALKDIKLDKLPVILSSNPDLLVVISIGFILGIIISSLIYAFSKASKEKKEIKKVECIVKPKEEDSKKGKTLFEKLTQDIEEKKGEGNKDKGKKEEEKIDDKKDVKEEKKQEKPEFLSKIDFLKDFKKFDPDDDKGKEKDNIKVSLTSKD